MAQVPASAAEADRATNQPQSDPLPGGISEEDAEVAVSVLGVMGRLDLHSFRGPSLKRLRNALAPCAALLSDPSPWLNGSFLALLWSGEMDVRGEVLRFLPLEDIGRVIPRLSKIFRDEQPVVLYRVARAVSPGVCEEALREFLGSTDKKIEDVFPDGPQEGKMKDAFDEVRGVGERIEEPILHEAIGKFLDVVHFEGRDFRVFCGDDLEAWGETVPRDGIRMIDDERLRWIQITSLDHAGSPDRIEIRHDFSEDNLCLRRVEFTIKFHHAVDDEASCGVIAGVSIDGLGKIVVKSDYDDEIYYSMLWVANHQSLDQGFDIDIVEPDTCYTVSIVVDWDNVGMAPYATVTMTTIPSGEKTPGYDYDFECPRCEPMKHVEIFNQANAVTLISSFSLKYSERIERDAQFVIDPDSDEDDSDDS